uniref:Putative secreted protein n=1 Tax=Anopheles darlingi TaxID=43151 RepID=A0A2M4DFH3_ANODA
MMMMMMALACTKLSVGFGLCAVWRWSEEAITASPTAEGVKGCSKRGTGAMRTGWYVAIFTSLSGVKYLRRKTVNKWCNTE